MIDEDNFQFSPAPTARPPAPSRTFQYSTGPPEPRYQPAQPVQSYSHNRLIHPTVPVQPRPEYIEIHKTPAQLMPEKYLSESDVTCKLNFQYGSRDDNKASMKKVKFGYISNTYN